MAVSLYVAHYDLCRVHESLPRTLGIRPRRPWRSGSQIIPGRFGELLDAARKAEKITPCGPQAIERCGPLPIRKKILQVTESVVLVRLRSLKTDNSRARRSRRPHPAPAQLPCVLRLRHTK